MNSPTPTTINATQMPPPAKKAFGAALTGTRSPDPAERQRARERLAALLWAARAAGWTWQALGEELDVSTSRAFQIAHQNSQQAGVDVDVEFPAYWRARVVEGFVQQSTPRELTGEEGRELRALAALAKRARGVVDEGDPRRTASRTLSVRIAQLHAEGVPWSALAAATSASVAGVRRRVARHGLARTIAPSVLAVEGVRTIHTTD